MPDFGAAERRILSYFKTGTKLFFNGRGCRVVESDKPTCPSGEPKTDIFVRVDDGRNYEDIKISYKKENADFLENKTNADRAEQLLGPYWREIIQESTSQIREQFYERALIYKEAFRRTEKGSMTLGWKFELLNKPGGDLSGQLDLSPQQVYDVYAGTNLSVDKRDAMVNGRIIEDSGVADYILNVDRVGSAQEVLQRMIPIDDYIRLHPYIYFACKALNYRTFTDKYDGNRPLAVQVDWHINEGKLVSDLVFDVPLEMNGTEMANRLKDCLDNLGIQTTDDIDDDNADMSNVYG
ncbi:MAG: hypothetical protein J5965_26455 [Aeriscardovia sp.]|nr:hypothetical protein [Aeriscardovia sp.]